MFFLLLIGMIVMPFKGLSENETSKLYQQTLCEYIAGEDKIDTIHIMKCFDIDIPSIVGRCHIVDVTDTLESFLKNREGLSVIKLFPIEVDNGSINVRISDYSATLESGEVMLGTFGCYIYQYKYSKLRKRYKLIGVKKYII